MSRICNFVEEHPVCAALVLIVIYAGVGVLDRRAELTQKAYQRGYSDALECVSATEDTTDLATLCQQPWPDAPGTIEARRISCGNAR